MEEQLKGWSEKLLGIFKAAPGQLESAYKKYASKKLMRASIFVEEWVRRMCPDCPAALAPRQITNKSDTNEL
jgi:hypothetical protein